MISKNEPSENPVGPETPAFEFPWSLWQVMLGLFVMAVGLTAWKLYEARFIAPKVPVDWQTFDLDQLLQTGRQNRDVLIVVVPTPQDQGVRQTGVTSSPEFQRAVYLARPLAMKIDLAEVAAEVRNWLPENLPPIENGGLAWLPLGDPRHARCLATDKITVSAAVALVDDPDTSP